MRRMKRRTFFVLLMGSFLAFLLFLVIGRLLFAEEIFGPYLTFRAMIPRANMWLEELTQPEAFIELVARGEEESYFRAFNPSVAKLPKPAVMVFAFRVSNYACCPLEKGGRMRLRAKISWQGRGKSVDKLKSAILMRVDQEGHDPVYVLLSVPDFPHAASCARGCEDPRLVVDPTGTMLYVLCNAQTTTKCLPKMFLIRVMVSALLAAVEGEEDVLQVQETDVVGLALAGSSTVRAEKNWMPLDMTDSESLLLVRLMHPHIVTSCSPRTGECVDVAETPTDIRLSFLRGGSQARLYKDKFVAFVHRALRWDSYVTQVYAFSSRPPYEILGVTQPFVIDIEKETADVICQFVSGFEIIQDVAYVTFGENDCLSKLLKVDMISLMSSLQPLNHALPSA